MNDITAIVFSELLIMVLSFGIIQYLTNGFLFPFLKVKASRGTKILVKVHSTTNTHFRVGKEEEGELVYTPKGHKEDKRINIDNSCVFRFLGVNCVAVNDKHNCVLKPDYKGVTGYDAFRVDNLITRAITKPNIEDTKEKIMIIAIFVILVLTAINLILTFKTGDVINTKLSGLESLIKTALSKMTGVV